MHGVNQSVARRYPSLAGLSRLLELESEPAFGVNQSVARRRVVKEAGNKHTKRRINDRFGFLATKMPSIRFVAVVPH